MFGKQEWLKNFLNNVGKFNSAEQVSQQQVDKTIEEQKKNKQELNVEITRTISTDTDNGGLSYLQERVQERGRQRKQTALIRKITLQSKNEKNPPQQKSQVQSVVEITTTNKSTVLDSSLTPTSNSKAVINDQPKSVAEKSIKVIDPDGLILRKLKAIYVETLKTSNKEVVTKTKEKLTVASEKRHEENKLQQLQDLEIDDLLKELEKEKINRIASINKAIGKNSAKKTEVTEKQLEIYVKLSLNAQYESLLRPSEYNDKESEQESSLEDCLSELKIFVESANKEIDFEKNYEQLYLKLFSPKYINLLIKSRDAFLEKAIFYLSVKQINDNQLNLHNFLKVCRGEFELSTSLEDKVFYESLVDAINAILLVNPTSERMLFDTQNKDISSLLFNITDLKKRRTFGGESYRKQWSSEIKFAYVLQIIFMSDESFSAWLSELNYIFSKENMMDFINYLKSNSRNIRQYLRGIVIGLASQENSEWLDKLSILDKSLDAIKETIIHEDNNIEKIFGLNSARKSLDVNVSETSQLLSLYVASVDSFRESLEKETDSHVRDVINQGMHLVPVSYYFSDYRIDNRIKIQTLIELCYAPESIQKLFFIEQFNGEKGENNIFSLCVLFKQYEKQLRKMPSITQQRIDFFAKQIEQYIAFAHLKESLPESFSFEPLISSRRPVAYTDLLLDGDHKKIFFFNFSILSFFGQIEYLIAQRRLENSTQTSTDFFTDLKKFQTDFSDITRKENYQRLVDFNEKLKNWDIGFLYEEDFSYSLLAENPQLKFAFLVLLCRKDKEKIDETILDQFVRKDGLENLNDLLKDLKANKADLMKLSTKESVERLVFILENSERLSVISKDSMGYKLTQAGSYLSLRTLCNLCNAEKLVQDEYLQSQLSRADGGDNLMRIFQDLKNGKNQLGQIWDIKGLYDSVKILFGSEMSRRAATERKPSVDKIKQDFFAELQEIFAFCLSPEKIKDYSLLKTAYENAKKADGYNLSKIMQVKASSNAPGLWEELLNPTKTAQDFFGGLTSGLLSVTSLVTQPVSNVLWGDSSNANPEAKLTDLINKYQQQINNLLVAPTVTHAHKPVAENKK